MAAQRELSGLLSAAAPLVSLCVLAAPAPALARFVGRATEDVPVERLLRNSERFVAQNPEDGRGYYILGRLHSMAFARGDEQVEVETDRPTDDVIRALSGEPSDIEKALSSVSAAPAVPKPSPPPPSGASAAREAPRAQPPPREEPLPRPVLRQILQKPKRTHEMTEARRAHLRAAVLSYRKAIALSSSEAPFFLGLGWALDQTAEIEGTDERAEALEAFRRAYRIAAQREDAQSILMPGTFLLAPEAGGEILRLLARKPALSSEEKAEKRAIEAGIKKIRNKPHLMTPIILPLESPGESLASLLSSATSVGFDLAGDGIPRAWPWVKPTTAILVWDPRGAGRVESGRQLFGASTWWCLWRNGYEPLDALDDDADGWLAGEELEGLSVWRDGDGDGVADPGEVVSARAAGIVGLASRPSGSKEGVPWNPAGARLSGGATRPTYDWTPTSASSRPGLAEARRPRSPIAAR